MLEFLLDIINNVATIIGLARDVVLMLLLTVALIALIVIARKVIGLLNTVRQTAEKAKDRVIILLNFMQQTQYLVVPKAQ
ncbi:MAG: hypothetical protein IIB17_10910 [Chloroflexi bacterium]|nr:hypothetical protein [Chloroflexota bacterium]